MVGVIPYTLFLQSLCAFECDDHARPEAAHLK